MRKTFAAAAAFAALPLCAVAQPRTSTAGADPILAGYTQIYSGDREGAYAHFEALHAREPESLAVWYGFLYVTQTRLGTQPSLEPSFEKGIEQFLAKADQRYGRSHADAEALFYLASGHLLRAQYRFEHDKGIWGAARDAAKAKGYSDEYLKQHPEHGDAYLTQGIYNYYVGIAPSFVRVLRVLLFLPSGNRGEGLTQLEKTARDGNLFAPMAEEILVDAYSGIERRVADAVRIAERLHQRFPQNFDYQVTLGQLYASPTLEAYGRASEQFNAVIAQTSSSTSMDQLRVRYRAILGLADLKRSQWQLEDAIALMTPPIDANVSKPAFVLPACLLRRGGYRGLLNDPNAADDLRRVLNDPKMNAYHKAAERQIATLDERRRTDEGAIYAQLIPGNRLAAERRWDEARAEYDKVGGAHPGDWQVRYRLAYLDFQRGNYDAASTALAQIVASAAKLPRWLRSTAMLNLAWTHDIGGRRTEAVKLYKKIVDEYEDQAAANAARLGLLTPYRAKS